MSSRNRRKLTYYMAKSRKASLWQRAESTWEVFRARATEFTVTAETYAEYVSMSKDRQTEIKDVGGFVGGELEGGIRKKSHLQTRSMITLDYDRFAASQLGALRETFPGVAWAAVSTHKHTAAQWRVRVIIPLGRDVDPEEYVAVSRKVAEMIGMDGIDRTTFEPCRMMFWPSRSTDADFISETNDGMAFLDPDRILDIYNDWRDAVEWPRTADEADLFSLPNIPTEDPRKLEIWLQYCGGSHGKGREAGSGMEDPEKKSGIIGAFCRCYGISEAIGRFLSEKYTLYRPGRYTYAGASTVGGAVVYDNRWLYSNHATDPASGREYNAWDLVRVHKFGHLDAGKQAATVGALPSSRAMTEFAMTDSRVKKAMAEETRRRGVEAFAGIDIESPAEWEDIEMSMRNKKGSIVATRHNIATMLLQHPDLKGTLRYNEFTRRLEVSGRLPWARPENLWFEDTDAACLRGWLETTYEINSQSKVLDALELIKGRVAYHPVKEYFDGLTWDGERRLERLFPDVLGAEDTELNRTLGRMIFTAAAARIYEPGIKFDLCVILYGPEGCGKSTLCAAMGGDWFTDNLPPIGTKDAQQALRGQLIVELGEMSSMKRAELDTVKNFISSRSDKYRPSYGRWEIDCPRQCVFIATTNDDQPLRGYEDNRRFPVVEIHPEMRKVQEGTWGYVPEHRDQLWAEAVALWKGGDFKLYLSPELSAEARAVGQRHNLDLNNAMFDIIDEYLDRPIPDNWAWRSREERKSWIAGRPVPLMSTDYELRQEVCFAEILTECLDLRPGTKEYITMAREVGRYMDRMHPEWERVHMTKGDPVFGRQKGWRRVAGLQKDEGEII